RGGLEAGAGVRQPGRHVLHGHDDVPGHRPQSLKAQGRRGLPSFRPHHSPTGPAATGTSHSHRDVDPSEPWRAPPVGGGSAADIGLVVAGAGGSGAVEDVVVDAAAVVVVVPGGAVVATGAGRVVAVGRAVVFVAGGAVVAGAGGGDDATRPEFGSATSDEVSRASKAPAGIVFSSSRRPVSQPGSDVPVKYQFEPLSATIRPWRCMARSTTWVSGRKCEMSNDALSRNHAPIGGSVGSAAAPAWWRAGQTKRRSVRAAVMRMAWSTSPAATSSRRSSPGRIGRPAASAEVQPFGRRAPLRRSHTAPDPAVGWPPFQSAA